MCDVCAQQMNWSELLFIRQKRKKKFLTWSLVWRSQAGQCRSQIDLAYISIFKKLKFSSQLFLGATWTVQVRRINKEKIFVTLWYHVQWIDEDITCNELMKISHTMNWRMISRTMNWRRYHVQWIDEDITYNELTNDITYNELKKISHNELTNYIMYNDSWIYGTISPTMNWWFFRSFEADSDETINEVLIRFHS